MSTFDDVERRWQIKLPASFRLMSERGLLSSDREASLCLSDTEWLDADEMLTCWLIEEQIDGLIPFAKEGRGSTWSWNKNWAEGDRLPVAHCPRDCSTGKGYAPDFEGTVYRLLLEEMSSSWLVEALEISPAQLGDRFRRYAEWTGAYLPRAWVDTLTNLASRPVQEDEEKCHFVLPYEEAKQIIKRDLAFAHLDQEFEHYRD